MFEAMLNGRIDTEELEFDLMFADIEQLNENIQSDGAPDVSKISYAMLPLVTGKYALLKSGSALGRKNGPLLVSRKEVDINDDKLRVAIPGEHTTANMLMSRIFPNITDKTPVLFSDITRVVRNGEFDAGVLIHESRFTYADHGLSLVADLGLEWEKRSGLPLPLGAIVVLRDLPLEVQLKVERVLRRSIEYAMKNRDASVCFVQEYAKELDREVIDKHIDMFVNEYSLDLGEDGTWAVRDLTGLKDEHIFIGAHADR